MIRVSPRSSRIEFMFRLLAITSVPHRVSICIIFIVLHLLGPVGCWIWKTVTVGHKDALIYRSIGARARELNTADVSVGRFRVRFN